MTTADELRRRFHLDAPPAEYDPWAGVPAHIRARADALLALARRYGITLDYSQALDQARQEAMTLHEVNP